jgi:hypothetical protein
MPPVDKLITLPDYEDVMAFTGSQKELDMLIEWRAGSIAVLKHYRLDTILKGAHMQRQINIELRFDFADRDKEPVIRETMMGLAIHALAATRLISDNPKATRVAVTSDDFFAPMETIELNADTLQKGFNQIGEATEADRPSEELLNALGS